MAADERPGCVLVDIDGTIAQHTGDMKQVFASPLALLPGTREIWGEWIRRGYRVVVTTGRRESMRAVTAKQLADAGLQYDQLVMDCGPGFRILYNDVKPGDPRPTAYAVNVERNKGMLPIEDVLGEREFIPSGRG